MPHAASVGICWGALPRSAPHRKVDEGQKRKRSVPCRWGLRRAWGLLLCLGVYRSSLTQSPGPGREWFQPFDLKMRTLRPGKVKCHVQWFSTSWWLAPGAREHFPKFKVSSWDKQFPDPGHRGGCGLFPHPREWTTDKSVPNKQRYWEKLSPLTFFFKMKRKNK